ncbi:amino acid ABC transporter permease [Leucobacter chromiireducens]|uniref:Amino acid ABC transporter permease n=1 Tax=Leucobacter chromiireducens subsp. solipictus TaxID=398235 RepID=A0ABS1SEY9_9MICO|nr:amino acid ABC transporter permease [Leucobacter chromiireducens]MBL3679120.1 amino acid ABC transporter permease [Leucobacter chromiireducens subsp. solipictus]
MNAAAPATPREALTVVESRHSGRWIAVIVIAILAIATVYTIFTNPRFQWEVVGKYMFNPSILSGLGRTLMLTVISMTIGILLGIVLAVARLSPNKIISGAAWMYSWFFRGTPLLVQLLLWFFLSALFPVVALGVPFGPEIFAIDTNSLITPFSAAILGLALNEAAYMSEIVRAGLLSVPKGQTEAAEAIGMTRLQTMSRVILPQAMRIIIPPTGNETIGMLKNTALVLVIGYADLLTSASLIYARTFETIPLLIVAAIWYLFITAILSVIQYYIERHYSKGFQAGRVQRERKVKLDTVTRPVDIGELIVDDESVQHVGRMS